MSDNFNVIFRGDIAPGFTLVEARQGLKDFFSLDDARVGQLFSGRPVTIKKNVTREKAEQFQTLLAGMGAVAEIVPAAEIVAVNAIPAGAAVPASAASPDSGSAEATKTAETASTESTATITIAPPGADVLKPEERSAIPQREIPTNHLSVDSPGADVLKPHERKKPVEVHIDLSGLKVEPIDESGDTGSGL